MKDKEFDNWLQGKLNELEKAYEDKSMSPPEEAGWTHISSKLTSQIKDSQFDLHLQSSLRDAKVLDTDANWEQFQYKLQLIRERRNKIAGTRIAEVLVLLLLFWTVSYVADPSVFPNSNQSTGVVAQHSLNSDNNSMAEIESNSSARFNPENSNTNNLRQTTVKNTKEGNSSSTSEKKKLKKPVSYYDDSRSSLVNSGQTHVSSEQTVNTLEAKENLRSESQKSLNNELSIQPSNESQDKLVRSSMDSLLSEEKTLESVIVKEKNEEKMVDKQVNQDNSTDKLDNIPSKILPSKKLALERNFWLHLGTGINLVSISPARRIPDYVNRKSIYSTSISKKIGINMKYENWIFETGFNFFNLSYNLGDYIVFENLGESVSIDEFIEMSYSLTEIPLLLHRRLYSGNKLDLSLFGGISIAICNKADFKVIKANAKKFDKLYYNPNESITFIDVDYNYGIENDHSLKGNSFTNLIGGLRLDYKLLEYFSLSATANYSNMLEAYGFGPIGHNYKNASLGIGMVYSFK